MTSPNVKDASDRNTILVDGSSVSAATATGPTGPVANNPSNISRTEIEGRGVDMTATANRVNSFEVAGMHPSRTEQQDCTLTQRSQSGKNVVIEVWDPPSDDDAHNRSNYKPTSHQDRTEKPILSELLTIDGDNDRSTVLPSPSTSGDKTSNFHVLGPDNNHCPRTNIERPTWWIRDMIRGKMTARKSGGGYAEMSNVFKKPKTETEKEANHRPTSSTTSSTNDTPTIIEGRRQLQYESRRTKKRYPTRRKYLPFPPTTTHTGRKSSKHARGRSDYTAFTPSSIFTAAQNDDNDHGGGDDSVEASISISSSPSYDNRDERDNDSCSVRIFPTVHRKKWVDPITNYPVEDFAICRVDDNPSSPRCVFKFRAFVGQSRIKSETARRGAFLAFLGAWERPDDYFHKPTTIPTTVPTQDPNPLSDVHGNLRPLVASHQSGFNSNIYLRLQDVCLNPPPSDHMYHIDWDLRGRSDADRPLSFAAVDVDAYTKEVKHIKKFNLVEHSRTMLEIGLYGPRRSEDRLKYWDFELKNWIFSNLPGIYAFEVDENLRGRCVDTSRMDDIDGMFDWQPRKTRLFVGPDWENYAETYASHKITQFIDITEHSTGKPTQDAQRSIPMYVNEVGYSKSGIDRDPNTKSHQPGWRKVHYLFRNSKLRKATSSSLKSNSVELLVNYGQHYERNREREGYGKRNLFSKVFSDSHLPSFLLRNFDDRKRMITLFEELGIRQLYATLEFIESEIHSNLLERFRSHFATLCKTNDVGVPSESLKAPNLSVEQLVALRRVYWLGQAIRDHLNCLRHANATSETMTCLIEQCHATVHTLENKISMSATIKSWPDFISFWRSTDFVDESGKRYQDALQNELKEEILFDIRYELVHPYDEGTWCPIACSLIDRLSESTLKHSTINLAPMYFADAIWAKDQILDRDTPLQQLALSADTVNFRYSLKSTDKKDEGKGGLCVVVHTHPIQRPTAPCPVTKNVCVDWKKKILTRRSASLCICDEWYLSRQVLFIVYAFASSHLSDSERMALLDLLLRNFSEHASEQAIRDFLALELNIDESCDEGLFGRIVPCVFREGWEKDQQVFPPWIGTDSTPSTDPIFYQVVLPILEFKLGWTIEYGDPDWVEPKRIDGLHFCAFPPGISRHEDCSLFFPHVNYFASQAEVIDYLKRDMRPWARFCVDYKDALADHCKLTLSAERIEDLFSIWSAEEYEKRKERIYNKRRNNLAKTFN